MQVGKFLIGLSGARADLLEWVPEERPRYLRVGAMLLNSSILALLSMVVALTAIGISIWLAVPAAAFWGVVVLNLDRLLVAGLHFPRPRKRVLAAVSRLIISVVAGGVVAMPLQLWVFRSAIDRRMRADGVNGRAGLLERLQALQQLSGSNHTVFLASWLIVVLVIMVMSLPQLIAVISLLGPPTTYQRIAEDLVAKNQLAERETHLALEAIRSARARTDVEHDAWVQGLLDTIDVLGPPPMDQSADTIDDRSAR
jgi:hypothetical protein